MGAKKCENNNKNLFFFPEHNRPNQGGSKWTSGADCDWDPARSRRPSRRHLLHRQAEAFAEQVRPRERAERRREQTTEGEQSRSLSGAPADAEMVVDAKTLGYIQCRDRGSSM